MPRPSLLAVATSVFVAGISNALIYTLGFLILLVVQFLAKAGGGNLSDVMTTSFTILVFCVVIFTFITFVIGFPIALAFWTFGYTGKWAFVIAPAIGIVPVVLMASSIFAVSPPTFLMIAAFAYLASAIMWLMLARPGWDWPSLRSAGPGPLAT